MSERKLPISRREFFKWFRNHTLELSATAVSSGAIAALLFYGEEGEKNSTPELNFQQELSMDNLQPFVPSVEISEQTDPETFKTIVKELFAFSNEVDAGHIRAVGKIPQTERRAWERSIPFQKDDQGQNVLRLKWGFRSNTQLGTYLPDITAREIAIGQFNYGLGIPFTSIKGMLNDPVEFFENFKNSRVINFYAGEPPMQYWPPSLEPEKKSPVTVVKPLELSPVQLAASLNEIVDSFNSRIAIQKRIPEIDPGKII